MLSAYIVDWLNLLLRWMHVIAGIAWIGASFYFIWLDNSLEPPSEENQKKGIGGQLSSIHAGGFYEVGKYKLAPPAMPQHLHWFKWEAYSTWITGFALFTLMFYVGANTYLLDTSKVDLAPWQGIMISLATFIGGWFVYEMLCRSPLAKSAWLLATLLLAFVTFLAWGLGQIFSDRAAYMQVGALIGTCMVANVFFVIMPGQRAMVAAVEKGEAPDPKYAVASKIRSVHNNYLTLPVIFLMISNHYPMTYGNAHAWAVLLAIILIGAWTRHFFNLRHKGVIKPGILVSAGIATGALVWVIAPPAPPVHNVKLVVSTKQAFQIVHKRCSRCHSANPTDRVFRVAPAGVMFDSIAEMEKWAPRIETRAVNSHDMPLLNKTHMTDEERKALGAWISSRK